MLKSLKIPFVLALWVAAVSAQADVDVGLGAYFFEPHERGVLAGTSPALQASPVLLVGMEKELSMRWGFDLRAGLFIPRSNDEGATIYETFLEARGSYRLATRWQALGGLGVEGRSIVMHQHQGDYEIHGSFVTPSQTVFSWLFTINAGIGFALDQRLRLEAQTMVANALAKETRKFRSLLAVTYAL